MIKRAVGAIAFSLMATTDITCARSLRGNTAEVVVVNNKAATTTEEAAAVAANTYLRNNPTVKDATLNGDKADVEAPPASFGFWTGGNKVRSKRGEWKLRKMERRRGLGR